MQPELNGLAFDPTFESWQPLSMTDRGDNRTFRFILGNIAAVKASQTGDISPWPDGARFAKIAWQQELGPDGLVHPGKFIQVELMVKNAEDYKDTEGWGWGRWRGLDLKPYGQDARFVNECTTCHQPLRGNDYVYTMPITTAQVSGTEVVNNAAAVANATNLPHQPLAWGAITMYVDPKNHTMATLYGNDAAMDAVEAHRTCSGVSSRRRAGAGDLGAAGRSALVRGAHSRSAAFRGIRRGRRPAALSALFRQRPWKRMRAPQRLPPSEPVLCWVFPRPNFRRQKLIAEWG